MQEKKALVAMSGGVDSSVAAYLAKTAGFSCEGAMLALLPNTDGTDAQAVSQRLGMPFRLIPAQSLFYCQVIDSFAACYEAGATPNPCITCNKTVKFGFLLEQALKEGFSHIVTGHYARIRKDPDTGRYLLYKAKDTAKDQSYFLAGLTQHQLAHTLFPLGELTKDQVREIAQAQGFLNARKKDSQDICFIPDGDYFAFLQGLRGKPYPQGDYLDISGKKVGTHKGAVGYTLGQRKGLGLAMGQPVYVCGKDMAANTVTVGPEEALFARELTVVDVNWLPFEVLSEPIAVSAKVRYRHTPQRATLYPTAEGKVKVIFDTPQRAITPGQAAVFYRDDMVIGSGTIL